jgi:CRP-like cAMP-binding protein
VSAKKTSVKKPKFRKLTDDEIVMRTMIFDTGMALGNFVTLSDSQVLVFGKNEFAELCAELQQFMTALIELKCSKKKGASL